MDRPFHNTLFFLTQTAYQAGIMPSCDNSKLFDVVNVFIEPNLPDPHAANAPHMAYLYDYINRKYTLLNNTPFVHIDITSHDKYLRKEQSYVPDILPSFVFRQYMHVEIDYYDLSNPPKYDLITRGDRLRYLVNTDSVMSIFVYNTLNNRSKYYLTCSVVSSFNTDGYVRMDPFLNKLFFPTKPNILLPDLSYNIPWDTRLIEVYEHILHIQQTAPYDYAEGNVVTTEYGCYLTYEVPLPEYLEDYGEYNFSRIYCLDLLIEYIMRNDMFVNVYLTMLDYCYVYEMLLNDYHPVPLHQKYFNKCHVLLEAICI